MAMFDKPKSGKPEAEAPATPAAPTSSSSTSYAPTSRSMATIGSSIRIKGDITGDENLTVEGSVEGKIDLKSHDVTIGSSGRVNADVRAKVITVNGEVEGDLKGVEKVLISKSGRVQGNISSPRVILEDGAKFKGSIDMDPAESPAVERASKPMAAARVTPVNNPDTQAELSGLAKNG